MATVTVKGNIDNDSKKVFLKKVNEAFSNMDMNALSEYLHDDIDWHMAGAESMSGKQAMIDEITKMADYAVVEMNIANIIVEGNTGAVNGEVNIKTGQKFQFCDVYELTGEEMPKVKTINSYMVEIK